jgi:hypothetical protein
METIIKADIFFFISAISSVVITILLAILLFYLIRAGRNLCIISEKLQQHFKESEEFVIDLKQRLENNIFFRLFFPAINSKRKDVKKEKK